MKNVLCFDLGNVLVSWRPPDEVVRDIVQRYGGDVNAVEQLFSNESGEKRWESIELSGVTPEAFWKRICRLTGIDETCLPLSEFMPLYVHDLQPIEPMVAFAREAQRKGFHLVVISNCDLARGQHIISFLEAFHGLQFLRVFISAREKMKKPQLINYALDVLSAEENIEPANCIFIDDVAEYVAAARAFGIDAVLHNATEDALSSLTLALREYGVII